jgi:hypothetical protein
MAQGPSTPVGFGTRATVHFVNKHQFREFRIFDNFCEKTFILLRFFCFNPPFIKQERFAKANLD